MRMLARRIQSRHHGPHSTHARLSPARILITDIAAALARMPCYSGPTRRPYTLAMRSLWAARLVLNASSDPLASRRTLLHYAPDVYNASTGQERVTISQALGLAGIASIHDEWAAWAYRLATRMETAISPPRRAKVLKAPHPGNPPGPFHGKIPPLYPPRPEHVVALEFIEIDASLEDATCVRAFHQ
ncbi:MAG: hypothetical protein ACYDHY_09710 [Acidiferrobacterales bacterium]